jgi:hypothetical protein
MSSSIDIDPTNLDPIKKLYADLSNEWLTCLDALLDRPELTEVCGANLLVAKARELNRRWNDLAKDDTRMKADGFKTLLKKQILGIKSIKGYLRQAIGYL